MFARTWEFESPLRHHKNINGLEEFIDSSSSLFFAPTSILPHFAPTFIFLLFFLSLTKNFLPISGQKTLVALCASKVSPKQYFTVKNSPTNSTPFVVLFCAPYPELPQAMPTWSGGVLFLALSAELFINTRRNLRESSEVAVTWWSQPDEPAAPNQPQVKGILLRKTKTP